MTHKAICDCRVAGPFENGREIDRWLIKVEANQAIKEAESELAGEPIKPYAYRVGAPEE